MTSVGTCSLLEGRLHGTQVAVGSELLMPHPTRARQGDFQRRPQPAGAAIGGRRGAQGNGTNLWRLRRRKLSGNTSVSSSPASSRGRNSVTRWLWISWSVERPAKATTLQRLGLPLVTQYSSLPLSLLPSGSRPPGSGQGGSGSRSGNLARVSA